MFYTIFYILPETQQLSSRRSANLRYWSSKFIRLLDRLTATANFYLSNLCDPTRDYTGTHLVNGDITIRPTDALTYTITYIHYIHLPVILKP